MAGALGMEVVAEAVEPDGWLRLLETLGRDQAIVEAILQMARTLGLSTVAEGVETEAELAFLAARGCSAIQGFIFGPPVPARQMAERFAQKRRLALPAR